MREIGGLCTNIRSVFEMYACTEQSVINSRLMIFGFIISYDAAPDAGQVKTFIACCDEFFQLHPGEIIGKEL